MNDELKEEVVIIELDRLVDKGLLKREKNKGEWTYVQN